mgnify:CR=1 FL=1
MRTKGPWHSISNGGDGRIIGPEGQFVADTIPRDSADPPSNPGEQAFNARLIAEAGTVAHDTGLAPRQLADQRAELLAMLKDVEWTQCIGEDSIRCPSCGLTKEEDHHPECSLRAAILRAESR